MNYEQANAVKELAAPVNKALEGLKVECPTCKGFGYSIYGGKIEDGAKATCPDCNGNCTIPYTYQPQVGEWCIHKEGGALQLISDTKQESNGSWLIKEESGQPQLYGVLAQSVTPILGWEEIERVLEKAGYFIEVRKEYQVKSNIKIWCRIWSKTGYAYAAPLFFGESRQEAVYRAVIELGKELK